MEHSCSLGLCKRPYTRYGELIMNAKDQKKVCDSGFIILRAEERNGKPIIKSKDLDHPDSWKTLRSDFKSKAERDRYMKELLEHDSYIED